MSSRDLNELAPPTHEDKVFLTSLWNFWLSHSGDHPNSKLSYLAGKWGLLPDLLQESYKRLGNNWGHSKFINEDLTEPTSNSAIPFAIIAWALRVSYPGLTSGTIKALSLQTKELMKHQIFELVATIGHD